MEQLDSVTKLLQTQLQPLSEARSLLEDIISETESSEQERNTCNSVFKGCKFVPKQIKLDYEKLHPNANIESGVCKIQEGNELSLDETAACESLLLVNIENLNDDDDDVQDNNEDINDIQEEVQWE